VAKLIIFTDIHFLPAGKRIIGLDPVQRLEAGIAHVHAHNADADLVVFTGDLTHHGDPESYARLKAVLAQLKLPSVLLIGNHDDRENFAEAFPTTRRDADGFIQSARDLDGARLLFLDTVKVPPFEGQGRHAGAYCAKRRVWLDRQLSEAGDRPVYLFMHHPPHKTGFAGMDRIRLEDEDAFYAVLEKHRNVRHLFAGHIHRTIGGSHRGVPFSIFKSTLHQQPLTFDGLDTSSSNAEPAAYGIVFTTPDGVLVHTDDYELSASLPIV
jgi:3',5'-cyclic-AMP phosphodiesterase